MAAALTAARSIPMLSPWRSRLAAAASARRRAWWGLPKSLQLGVAVHRPSTLIAPQAQVGR
jgi:hypothetical protein